MPKRWRRTILYSGCLFFVTLILLEIGVRIWGYSEGNIYDPIYRSFESSEDIPYIHKPNLVQARGRGLAVMNTDSLGLRSKTYGTRYGPKTRDEFRISIVGDSVTFGEGIPRTEDTYGQVLEDLLNQRQNGWKVKVFNFGVSAYSVKQMAATLPNRMVDIQPDLVVMAIIPDDFNLSRTPLTNTAGYLVTPAEMFLSNLTIQEILRSVRLMYVFRDIGRRWIWPSPLLHERPINEQIPKSYQYIQQFQKTADHLGLHYLVLLLPRMEKNAWGLLPARLTGDFITFLDLSPLSKEFTRDRYMASRFDRHASSAVHRRIAESLAEYVQHSPGFSH